jgi:hypothetical protein
VWEDQRFTHSGGVTAVYGRKLSLRGQADGDEVRLTGDDEDADFPDSDASATRLGLAYVVEGPLLPDGSEPSTSIRFRSFDLAFGDDTGSVELGGDGQQPSIVHVDGGFVVAWHTGSQARNFGGSLQAAALDERGNLVAQGPITTGDTHAKHRSLVSLGDRVLVVWSATPSDSEPFQLFYEVIDARDLGVVVARQLLEKSSWPLIEPSARLGPNGDVGVVYNENGSYRAYFTHLGCKLGPSLGQ